MLQQAVQDALLCTHVHPEGIEGAFIQAAAVAALCRTTSGKRSALHVITQAQSIFLQECKESLTPKQIHMQTASQPEE